MEFIILGCGSSMGVPRPDGFFGNCDPKIKRNYRTRCSALFKTSNQNILIDTSPDLRQQLLLHKIKKINKVLYSHMHGDQTHGINDLRSFYINSKTQIKVYADKSTSKYLKDSFSYIFKSYSKEYPATLKLNNLPKNIFATNKDKKIKINSFDEDLRQLVETRIKMTRQKLDNQNLQKLLKKRIEVTRSILDLDNTTQ